MRAKPTRQARENGTSRHRPGRSGVTTVATAKAMAV